MKILFIALTVLFYTSIINAQTINLALLPGGGTVSQVQAIERSIPSTFRINFTGGTTATTNIAFTVTPVSPTPGAPVFTGGGNTFTDGNITINLLQNGTTSAHLEITGTPNSIEREVNFTIAAANGTRSRTAQCKLALRNPIKLVFVVDRSGSMECRPNEPTTTTGPTGWPDCETNTPQKWSLARDAIQQFSSNMSAASTTFLNTDLVGISYFDGIINPSTIIGTGFVGIPGFASGIVGDFDAQNATGDLGRNGTNIGAGMLDAKTKIGSLVPNFREIIVLITDGMQNRGPEVVETGANPGKTLTDGTVLNNDQSLGAGNFIQVYTMGFDGTVSVGSLGFLLSRISTNTTNNYFFTSSPGTYSPVFTDLYARIFSQFSPQVVRLTSKSLSNQIIEETFTCNNGGSYLLFNVGFENDLASAYTYSLEKDGQDLTAFTKKTVGIYSSSLSISFIDHPDLNSGGIWKLICRRNNDRFSMAASAAVKASLSCTIEEPVFDLEYSLDKTEYQAGDKMSPSVRITRNGLPVKNAQVTAQLVKPGDDKGDLVARSKVSFSFDPKSELNNVYSAKFAQIMAINPAYLNSLAPVSNIITLNEKRDGFYDGQFPGVLDVSDNYNIVFNVSFTDNELGIVKRYNRTNTFVRFGDININLAKKNLKTFRGEGKRSYEITVTPAYEVGNKTRLVGPGYGQAFSTGKDYKPLKDIKDNGDGSYTIDLGQQAGGALNLLDEQIYKGPFLFFGMPYTKYKWNVSAHAGRTAPTGVFDSLYNPGAYAEIDFGRRLLPFLSVDLLGGYYGFKNDNYVLGGSACLTAYLLANSNWHIGISGGGGYYFPKNEDATTGYTGRLSLERNFNQHVTFLGELGFFKLPEPDISFTNFGLGFKYRF